MWEQCHTLSIPSFFYKVLKTCYILICGVFYTRLISALQKWGNKFWWATWSNYFFFFFYPLSFQLSPFGKSCNRCCQTFFFFLLIKTKSGTRPLENENYTSLILDDFRLQCRVLNKPYDIFGTWYNHDYLLSGGLKWLGQMVCIVCL